MTSAPSPFSPSIPGLQLAWDSTSLGVFKRCPREYYFTIVLGWQPRSQSVHLTFGIYLHKAREIYEKAKARGASWEDATDEALDYALRATWDSKLQRPWVSDDAQKNRWTLVRTLIWFLDEFREDPLHTVILANGQPAVELSFRFEPGLSPVASPEEHFVLCGHLDRVIEYEGQVYINDIKSTGKTLDSSFFDQFTPDNQMTLYTLAGNIVLALPVRGIMVDGAQVAVTFSRFGRGLIPRHEEFVLEWLEELKLWLRQAEMYATAKRWPGNDKSCFRCAFRHVCSMPPSAREQWLAAGFTHRPWNPLESRGDV